MDYSPPWLQAEHDVDLAELSHQDVTPTLKRWTPSKLKAKKASLLRQIQRELDRKTATEALMEECLVLAETLASLEKANTSFRFPKAFKKEK